MTRDVVVAFPLSDPAVPAEGNPGRHVPVNPPVKFFRSKFRVTSWWLEERPRLSYARPQYVCWPPLKPGLPALQS
jgi:hypothetical protein